MIFGFRSNIRFISFDGSVLCNRKPLHRPIVAFSPSISTPGWLLYHLSGDLTLHCWLFKQYKYWLTLLNLHLCSIDAKTLHYCHLERRQPEQNLLTTQTVSSKRRSPQISYDESNGGKPISLTDPSNAQRAMSKKCVWDKVCRSICGLKIHRVLMGYVLAVEASYRKGIQTGEMQEEPGAESPHSAWNLEVVKTYTLNIKPDRT